VVVVTTCFALPVLPLPDDDDDDDDRGGRRTPLPPPLLLLLLLPLPLLPNPGVMVLLLRVLPVELFPVVGERDSFPGDEEYPGDGVVGDSDNEPSGPNRCLSPE